MKHSASRPRPAIPASPRAPRFFVGYRLKHATSARCPAGAPSVSRAPIDWAAELGAEPLLSSAMIQQGSGSGWVVYVLAASAVGVIGYVAAARQRSSTATSTRRSGGR